MPPLRAISPLRCVLLHPYPDLVCPTSPSKDLDISVHDVDKCDLSVHEPISTPDKKKKAKSKSDDGSSTNGRWTKEEHERFVEAYKLYGKNWKKVQEYVGTRTTTQARSHAQKYFAKLQKNPDGEASSAEGTSASPLPAQASPSPAPAKEKENTGDKEDEKNTTGPFAKAIKGGKRKCPSDKNESENVEPERKTLAPISVPAMEKNEPIMSFRTEVAPTEGFSYFERNWDLLGGNAQQTSNTGLGLEVEFDYFPQRYEGLAQCPFSDSLQEPVFDNLMPEFVKPLDLVDCPDIDLLTGPRDISL